MSQLPVRRRPDGAPESQEVVAPIDLLSRDNPRSVINLVTPALQAHIFTAVKDRSDLFRLGEKELRKQLKPTPTDNRLRLAFWNEYNLAQASNESMTMASVYAGICTKQYFEGYYISDPNNLAWMLCPPTNYIIAMEEVLETSSDKLRQILEADIIDPKTGKVDVKLGELILKIHQSAENRVKGAVVVRKEIRGQMETKNLNYNVDANAARGESTSPAVKAAEASESIEEIERKLQAIRKKAAAKERAQDAIVVEGKHVDEPGAADPGG